MKKRVLIILPLEYHYLLKDNDPKILTFPSSSPKNMFQAIEIIEECRIIAIKAKVVIALFSWQLNEIKNFTNSIFLLEY